MNRDNSPLAKAIGKGLAESSPAGPCPALEEIAALVDGAVTGAERDLLLGHFASCDSCRETFVRSRELTSAGSAGAKRNRYLLPSAFAAAAVMVLALSVALHAPGPSPAGAPAAKVADAARNSAAVAPTVAMAPASQSEPSPVAPSTPARPEAAGGRRGGTALSASAIAARLTGSGDAAQLAALTSTQEKSFGFAAAGDAKSGAFRAGRAAVDLEVALAASDGDRAQAAANRLATVLQSLAPNADVKAIDDLNSRLERGDKANQFGGATARFLVAIPAGQQGYVRLGEWAEGARLAVKSGNARFFSGGVPKALTAASLPDCPPEVRKALAALEKGSKGKRVDLTTMAARVDELIHAF
ncbi:zf-HC2 domain-containing protein [Geomonas sp. Red32]|uniref:zf-HC2 domain-containing protein n=1 Tax=Geomonas sp. Red32 TaxID=2912856 RepID=UPI00202CAE7E|nr:zf-HC2 domain-containing protein [Geomonas sp. Red32]MCM0083507.1 zf-HC2 domain-containing protein [Geomonas sp. Red32]